MVEFYVKRPVVGLALSHEALAWSQASQKGSGLLKAVILKKAAEDDGDYLGKDLDSDRCTSLRKMLYLKY